MAAGTRFTWLVTGGAGYIGQHVVRELLAADYQVRVLDDLSSGSADLLPEGVSLVAGSINDSADLDEAFRGEPVDGVVHLAALKAADESVSRPLDYYRVNVEGTRLLLEAMSRHLVQRIIYSSSAAVYGEVDATAVTEDHATIPLNPYGETKLVSEWLVRNFANASGMSWLTLRYFNVAGAASPELADKAGRNLIPIVLKALAAGRSPTVFGDNYPTPDGTCIRDYVHVSDIAGAHLAAAAYMYHPHVSGTYNVGCGRGYSVREVIAAATRISGQHFDADVRGPRPGDAAWVVADAARLRLDLGWTARHSLDDMIASNWQGVRHGS